jgi:hypothetical protein
MLDDWPGNTSSAADERSKSCGDLGNMERLGHIIVRAGIKAVDLLRPGSPRRKDEHRDVPFLDSPPFEDLEALHFRQPKVKDHSSVGLGRTELVTVLAVGRAVYNITGLSKSGGQTLGDLVVILNQQNTNLLLPSVCAA